MKKVLAIGALVIATIPAYAATAIWTGRMEFVTTVTYQQAVKCEYQIYGNTFWRLFQSSCPGTVEVQ